MRFFISSPSLLPSPPLGKQFWFVFSQILLARLLVVQVQTVHTTSVNDAGKCGVFGGGTSVTDGSELDLRDLVAHDMNH